MHVPHIEINKPFGKCMFPAPHRSTPSKSNLRTNFNGVVIGGMIHLFLYSHFFLNKRYLFSVNSIDR